MASPSITDVRVKYVIYGTLFGLVFPVLATFFDAFVRDLGFGVAALIEVQRTQPLHWIIDSAPLVIGLIAYLAGTKQHEVMEVNATLEHKVEERTRTLHEHNNKLQETHNKLEESLHRISQSINYAQGIQDAIIVSTTELKASFPDSFVMFRPRDVVSGDFPWYLKKGDLHYMAAVDCTGHGVPGAFMSLIGYFLLNKIVAEPNVNDTGEILSTLHREIVKVLNQNTDSEVHDGMDMAICRVDESKQEIMYSGAGNLIYHLSGKKLTEYKGDIYSIGGIHTKERRCAYASQVFNYEKGDVISMFSDGITDQFSADSTTKFGYKRVRKYLTENHARPMSEMAGSFEKEMDHWMGEHRQMDDMLLMGVRF